MKQRLPLIHPNAMVWRISEGAPLGEWVDKAAPAARPTKQDQLPDVLYGSWVTSSFDLLSGSDTLEVSDTIPDDLFDELFQPSSSKKPRAAKK